MAKTKWLSLAAAVTLVAGGIFFFQPPGQAAEIVVYKSPTCGCCKKWVSHLERYGFSVEARDRRDVNPIKAELGIPPGLHSCHTATVDGYIIEGHAPADDILRLLKERPRVKGLAVPGMPVGAPGMEGARKDPYNVLTFEEDGKTTVYFSYHQQGGEND